MLNAIRPAAALLAAVVLVSGEDDSGAMSPARRALLD